MSTKQANAALDFLPEAQGSMIGTLFGPVRKFFSALAEGKAAADQYESLVRAAWRRAKHRRSCSTSTSGSANSFPA
ncbi:MAG: hypothetical protein HC869_01465 [Rhodospirillales bacterium]|nr:hypothetical protein [Rhodospirillales bacterium]